MEGALAEIIEAEINGEEVEDNEVGVTCGPEDEEMFEMADLERSSNVISSDNFDEKFEKAMQVLKPVDETDAHIVDALAPCMFVTQNAGVLEEWLLRVTACAAILEQRRVGLSKLSGNGKKGLAELLRATSHVGGEG